MAQRKPLGHQLWLGAAAGLAFLLSATGCSQASTKAVHETTSTLSSVQRAVTSTLDGRTVLPHRIQWQAFPNPSGNITEVDFLIDGKQLWGERKGPYYYGGNGNYLVTSSLAPGSHTFTVHVVYANGSVATDTVTASIPPANQG
jgi:hypothetical protein